MMDLKYRILNTASSSIKQLSLEESLALSQEMQKQVKTLKADYIVNDLVDYAAIKESEAFKAYQQVAQELNGVDVGAFSDNQRKAFFINVYNALTIHGIISLPELPDSVLRVRQFWKNTSYNIGGYEYTLDDIEHGILRGNRSHPASSQPNYFKQDDPKIKYALRELDPRIHFALNCGAKSCPAVLSYSEENLESALERAAKSFCNQELIVLPKNEEIYISKLFEWYGADFGQNDIDAVRWTMKYLDVDKQAQVGILLHGMEKVGAGRILYNEYDWSLNKTY